MLVRCLTIEDILQSDSGDFDMMFLRTKRSQPYFCSRNDTFNRSKAMEIDFVAAGQKKPYAIEVKSGRYRPHASLDKFQAAFGKRLEQPVILYTKDVMESDGILHLPLYMAGLL